MNDHTHLWVRPIKLNRVDGYEGPVDVYDCACGVRRVMRRGEHPDSAVCDCRDVAYKQLQTHDQWGSQDNGYCLSSPMELLLNQQEKTDG